MWEYTIAMHISQVLFGFPVVMLLILVTVQPVDVGEGFAALLTMVVYGLVFGLIGAALRANTNLGDWSFGVAVAPIYLLGGWLYFTRVYLPRKRGEQADDN